MAPETAVPGSERRALGESSAGFFVDEAQVERRTVGDRSAGRLDDVIPPGRSPAFFHLIGEAGRIDRGDSLSKQGTKDAMHQPARSAIHQREGGGDQRMIGRAEPDLLGQCQAEHHPRLAVVRELLARSAIDQRVEIGQPAQCFSGDGASQRGVGRRKAPGDLGRIVHRLAAPQHCIEDAEGCLPGFETLQGIFVRAWHPAL